MKDYFNMLTILRISLSIHSVSFY